jgi:alpha-L-fucosidase 2
LPALPVTWKKGYIHGLMARGGFEVNIDWENGKLKQAKITSKLGNPLKLSYAGKTIELKTTERGKSYVFNEGLSGLTNN